MGKAKILKFDAVATAKIGYSVDVLQFDYRALTRIFVPARPLSTNTSRSSAIDLSESGANFMGMLEHADHFRFLLLNRPFPRAV